MAHPHLPHDDEVDQAIPEREPAARAGHTLARLVIPGVLVVVGVVLLIVGLTLVGIAVIVAGVIAFVADRLARLGIVSQGDRDREARRRQEMRRTGRWTH